MKKVKPPFPHFQQTKKRKENKPMRIFYEDPRTNNLTAQISQMLRDEKWIEVPKLTPEVVFITGDPYATMTREGGGHTVYIMEEETPVPPY